MRGPCEESAWEGPCEEAAGLEPVWEGPCEEAAGAEPAWEGRRAAGRLAREGPAVEKRPPARPQVQVVGRYPCNVAGWVERGKTIGIAAARTNNFTSRRHNSCPGLAFFLDTRSTYFF